MSWAGGGFLGVDAFFVLSGYLITSLLLVEWRGHGSIAPLAFWARRARRLLPALFLMLIGVALYAVFFAGPLELERIRGDALATIGYVANWRPIFEGQSYFDRYSIPSPLRHTWSLGIEEQYYVVWPLLVLIVLRVRRLPLNTLLTLSLVLLAASAILMGVLFQPDSDPSRVYYGTDTRAQSILVGAVLAMLLFRLGPLRGELTGPVLQIAAVQCAFFIGFLWCTTSENNTLLYRGGFFFLAVAVAIVIAAAVQPKVGPIGRVLSLPPLRALGLISYGVYLWHWPVYLILTPGRTGWEGYWLFAVRVLATLAIATASYFLIEMPIRRGAFRPWKLSWTLAPAGAVSLAVVLVLVTRGAISPTAFRSVSPMPQIDATANPQPIRVMVLGDSVALSLEPGLEQVGKDWNLAVWDMSSLGCSFLHVDKATNNEWKLSKKWADGCNEWHKTWKLDVDAFRPDLVIMLFGGPAREDYLVDGHTLEPGTLEWHTYVMSGLETQMDVLTSQGGKLVLMTFPYSRPTQYSLLPDADEREQDDFVGVTELNKLYREFAEQHPDEVVLIDLNSFACPEGKFTDLVINGVKMREDGIHFTPNSSYIVAEWLVPQLAVAAADSGP